VFRQPIDVHIKIEVKLPLIFCEMLVPLGPPLWSSGQSSGYRSGGPGSISGTTRKKVVGLERGPLSHVSTNEELLNRKVAAPV
jgi:hypothetical protein